MSADMISRNCYSILLQQCFTLSARDRTGIRKAFRSRHWIGAALQLGFLGMIGTTLRSLEYVPAAVLRHLGRQFRRPSPLVKCGSVERICIFEETTRMQQVLI
jgi:hypothetical protein